jgi:hypothetical protein
MADKKRDILEFVEQSNFEQFTPNLVYNGLLKNRASVSDLKMIEN